MTTPTLRAAIVGAGIAGLTAAIALRRIGIDCQVFERASRLREVGAGIQLSPNGTRVLRQLGLIRDLDKVAVRPESIDVRQWDDDSTITRTALGQACDEMYGAPYLTLRRADLHQTLLNQLPPEVVHLGRQGTAVSMGNHGATLKFADGGGVEADVVLAADGIRSTLREQLLGDAPRFSGHTMYRGLVPSDRLPESAREPRVSIRMGPGQHCVSYPISGGELISFAASVPAEEGWAVESWLAPGDVSDLLASYDGWAPAVRQLLGATSSLTRWALFDRPDVDQWTNDRLALVGDAAHPMLPFGAQGASQAIEDIAALAVSLEGATSDSVADCLRHYASVRQARVRQVSSFIAANEKNHHIEDDDARKDRDSQAAQDFGLRERAWLFGYHADRKATR